MEKRKNNLLIRLSQLVTLIMVIDTIIIDITAVWSAKFICYCYMARYDDFGIRMVSISIWLGTIGIYVVLFSVYILLNNIAKNIVFDKKNTKLMSVIFCGLTGAGVASIIGSVIWPQALIFTVIALFTALIVITVKICFDRAIAMKEELELTI